eukprot:2993033-Pleurochrysis_carterae.AAC.1
MAQRQFSKMARGQFRKMARMRVRSMWLVIHAPMLMIPMTTWATSRQIRPKSNSSRTRAPCDLGASRALATAAAATVAATVAAARAEAATATEAAAAAARELR